MGKAHRLRTIRAFTELIYSRDMTPRFERQVRRAALYAESVRLVGQAEVERMLDTCPRPVRNQSR